AERCFHAGLQAGDDPTKARPWYRCAAAAYQRLADDGYADPDLFLNLGNAHLLADELPQAILAYRRGLRGHPLHGELWENLTAARALVAYPGGDARHRPPGDPGLPWLPRPALDTLLCAAVGLHGLGWLALGGWLVLRRRPAGLVAAALFTAAALA